MEDINIYFSECVVENNQIWCITDADTYLYRIDREKNVVDIITALTKKPLNSYFSFGAILPYREKLIIIPKRENKIVIFNKLNMKKEYIEIPNDFNLIGTTGKKFCSGIVYKDYVYMFGYAYPGILRFDIVNKSFKIISDWVNHENLFVNDAIDGYFFKKYFLKDNTVYFPFMNANALIKFSLDTEEFEVIKVGDDVQRYISIEWTGTDFWLIPRDAEQGRILKWNPISYKIQYFDCYPEKFRFTKYAFYQTVYRNGKIFLFANAANFNINIDVQTGEMHIFSDLYNTSNLSGCKYPIIKEVNNKVFAMDATKEEYLLVDLETGHKTNFHYQFSEKTKLYLDCKRIWKLNLRESNGKSRVFAENNDVDLKKLIEYMLISSDIELQDTLPQCSNGEVVQIIGTHIYNEILTENQ